MVLDLTPPIPPEKPVYEVNKELVCSTSHITLEDAKKLTYMTGVTTTEYAWRLYVGDPVLADSYAEILSAKPLVELAKSLDCVWLVLDQDGPIYPDLAAYEW